MNFRGRFPGRRRKLTNLNLCMTNGGYSLIIWCMKQIDPPHSFWVINFRAGALEKGGKLFEPSPLIPR